jgi:hypothetical protein
MGPYHVRQFTHLRQGRCPQALGSCGCAAAVSSCRVLPRRSLAETGAAWRRRDGRRHPFRVPNVSQLCGFWRTRQRLECARVYRRFGPCPLSLCGVQLQLPGSPFTLQLFNPHIPHCPGVSARRLFAARRGYLAQSRFAAALHCAIRSQMSARQKNI